METYQDSHEGILDIMNHVCDCLGDENTRLLTSLLQKAVAAVDALPRSESERNEPE